MSASYNKGHKVAGVVFCPTNPPVYGGAIAKNPGAYQRKRRGVARLIVGLKLGRPGPLGKPGDELPFDRLEKFVIQQRAKDVGRSGGASYVMQRGHWFDPGTRRLVTERSIEISIFAEPQTETGKNETTQAVFWRHVKRLVVGILDHLQQQEVLIDLTWLGRLVEEGSFSYVK